MDKRTKEEILHILSAEADMTLACVGDEGQPEASTVSYVSDGLRLYFGTDQHSRKAAHIAADARVSLTINRPYRFWKDIKGLAISGLATKVTDAAEYRHVGRLLFERFPEVHRYARTESETITLFRIDPIHITLLDYSQGFGNSQHLETGP